MQCISEEKNWMLISLGVQHHKYGKLIISCSSNSLINHRITDSMVGVGRDLWRSSSPTPLLKWVHLERVNNIMVSKTFFLKGKQAFLRGYIFRREISNAIKCGTFKSVWNLAVGELI